MSEGIDKPTHFLFHRVAGLAPLPYLKGTAVSFVKRMQHNPIIFLLSLLATILSIASGVALIDPTQSRFLQGMGHFFANPWVALAIVTLFIFLIIALTWSVWQVMSRRHIIMAADRPSRIQGRRLFEYEGLYPINIAPGKNLPSLDSAIFVKAINYFLTEADDRLAAMDLVYLREDNRQHTHDVLPPQHNALYDQLLSRYHLRKFRIHYSRETDRLFRNVIRMINDLGDTLAGIHCEILLHDVRNPIRSIIAARNTDAVSGRRLYEPSTRFVVEYLKNQGKYLMEAMQSGGKVAYLKQFTTNKQVKATTIPLHDDQYGLIGLLCFNIDIDAGPKLR